MTDAGLYHVIRNILDSKTKTAARGFLDQLGRDYLPIAQELLDRLTFKRTGDQNSLIYKWYSEVGNATGETPNEVRMRAKLDIGTVILCRDDPDYLDACKAAMTHLGREDRLKRVMPYWPVTSLMNTKQATEYLDTFERVHRAQGIDLSTPERDAA